MFVDFDKVFNNKPQPQVKIPDAFLDYLNRQHLPNGIKYAMDADGNCIITTDNSSLTLGGFQFAIPPEDKKILGKKFSENDVLHLYYNRQKPIPLQLKKPGVIVLNGEEFPVEKVLLNPHNPINVQSGSFYMFPAPFPEPFHIKVGCAEYERDVLVSRVPHDSTNISAFESQKEAPLCISYTFNPDSNCLSMNMTFNFSYAKTIRDIVESTRIYNAYLDGKGYICGHPLTSKLAGDNARKFEEASAEFWEKVLKIEEHMGVSFIPPQEDVDYDAICLVEHLYQNLIQKVPIRETEKPDTLDGIWTTKSEEDIKSYIGSAVYFEFQASRVFDLFGAKFTLHGLVGIINAVLSGFTQKEEKQKIILADMSEEKTRYTASLFFKTEEELKEYRDRDHNKRIADFHNAKRAREFLIAD